MAALARSRARRPAPFVRGAGLCSVILVALTPASVLAQYSTQGRWSLPYGSPGSADWGITAIHMALLPGQSSGADASHSQVLYYGRASGGIMPAKAWLWDPLAVPTTAKMRTVNFTTDVFCGGHSAQENGQLLITGGNYDIDIGMEKVHRFDPQNLSSPWQAQPDMTYGRWYPTNTELGSGNTLVTAGSQHWWMTVFGGRDASRARHRPTTIATPWLRRP